MQNKQPPIVCAISASDSSAHAGHQCDLRVIQDLGCHGSSVISGITAQNSQSIRAVESTKEPIFSQQLEAVSNDITIAAVKTGLLLTVEQIDSVVKALSGKGIPLIVDPVLASTSGSAFDSKALLEGYRRLLTITNLLTPNLPEAELLLGSTIATDEDIILAAQDFRSLGAKAVLIKGGHRDTNDFVFDYFDDGERQFWLKQEKHISTNTRGTGCTLASAVASFIAQGKALVDAVVLANAYVHQGIRYGFSIGSGNGLLGNQGWPDQLSDYPTLVNKPSCVDITAFSSCDTHHLGLYPIVDSITWLERLVSLGITTLQLRVKDTPSDHLDKLIGSAVAIGKKNNARVFINDHWQLAIKHGAYGVHLGQEDLDEASLSEIRSSGLRLGLSSHSEYEWARASSLKPSYIAMGAVYSTNTKSVKTIGIDNLQQWVNVLSAHYPTVAIGGITPNNIRQVMQTGVGSCAVIGAITGSDNYQASVMELLSKIEGSK